MNLWNPSRQTVRLPRWKKTKRAPPRQTLRLTPYTWAKLVCLRDLGPTEVGAFGSSNPDDLLLVEDLTLVRQLSSSVTVKFEDEAVADYFDAQTDLGRQPQEFGRIWIHTHPGNSPVPSGTDEATFERCFGQSDWAVMLILARGGYSYARLRFAAGPAGELELPVEIDFGVPFPAADFAAWDAEYQQNVGIEPLDPPRIAGLLQEPSGLSGAINAEAGLISSSYWPREAWYDDRYF